MPLPEQDQDLDKRIVDATAFLQRYARVSPPEMKQQLESMIDTFALAKARIEILENQVTELPSVRDAYTQAVVQGLLAAGQHMYNAGSTESRQRLCMDVRRIVDDLMMGR